MSVVIPVYNERQTVGIVIEKVLNIESLLEVIVVDDHSTDGSDEVIADFAAA